MDLGEIGLEGVDWIHLAQDKNWQQSLMNIQVPQKAGNFVTS
jgi:hypothetical protein